VYINLRVVDIKLHLYRWMMDKTRRWVVYINLHLYRWRWVDICIYIDERYIKLICGLCS
jgi:hypothetical protein